MQKVKRLSGIYYVRPTKLVRLRIGGNWVMLSPQKQYIAVKVSYQIKTEPTSILIMRDSAWDDKNYVLLPESRVRNEFSYNNAKRCENTDQIVRFINEGAEMGSREKKLQII